MRFLPKWVLANPFPALHDTESLTVIQQTARLYGAMNEMIAEYNRFAEQLNEEIANFDRFGEEEVNNFKRYIEQRLMCKFEELDALFAKMKVDLTRYTDDHITEKYLQQTHEQLSEIVTEKILSGDIEINLIYDPETESLNMTTGEA